MHTEAISAFDRVSNLSRSACQTTIGYYSQLGKVISDFTKPYLPPIAQSAVETLYSAAPVMIPVLFLPDFISKVAIPGAVCVVNKRKIQQILGPVVTNALYDGVFNLVLVNAVCDVVCRRGYWVAADVAFAAVLHLQKNAQTTSMIN